MSDASTLLHVNGCAHSVPADGPTPLLYALRNDLGLTAARFGCGLGQCGACHVLVDGRSVPSCDTPLWSCQDKPITTLEGLQDDPVMQALLRAFEQEQAIQCGYCVNGILITAKTLLEANVLPSESQILQALDGHLCRCGTHWRFVRAILRAARDRQPRSS
jgi:nicotinate dehydrogenase subunit A